MADTQQDESVRGRTGYNLTDERRTFILDHLDWSTDRLASVMNIPPYAVQAFLSRPEMTVARKRQEAKRIELALSKASDDATLAKVDRQPRLSDKWAWSETFREVLEGQWDGTDGSLRTLAQSQQIPLAVLERWVADHAVRPKAPRETLPALNIVPIAPLAQAVAEAVPMRDVTLEEVSAGPTLREWLTTPPAATSASRRGIAAFHIGPALILRLSDGYRLLTPDSDWPDEALSPRLIERIVRLLTGQDAQRPGGVAYGLAEGAESEERDAS